MNWVAPVEYGNGELPEVLLEVTRAELPPGLERLHGLFHGDAVDDSKEVVRFRGVDAGYLVEGSIEDGFVIFDERGGWPPAGRVGDADGTRAMVAQPCQLAGQLVEPVEVLIEGLRVGLALVGVPEVGHPAPAVLHSGVEIECVQSTCVVARLACLGVLFALGVVEGRDHRLLVHGEGGG